MARVLLVIDRLGSGGAQTQLALLAHGLNRLGHDVALVTYYPSEVLRLSAYVGSVEWIFLDKRSRASVGPVNGLVRVLRSGRFDAVIAFLATPVLYVTAACLLAGFQGNVIAGERSAFASGRPSLRDRALRLFLGRATFVVANSRAHLTVFQRSFPRLADRALFIPNGVDFNEGPHGSSVERHRRQILCVGRVVREKNVEVVVKALRKLLDLGMPGVSVTWVGRIHDLQYWNECNELLAQLGLGEHWCWAGEVADVSPYYATAGCLVLVSRYEGMPNAVCEALSFGLPCVVSDVGDAKWLVGDGERGLCLRSVEPDALAHAIFSVLERSQLEYVEMCHRAKSFARMELSVDAMVERYSVLIAD